MEKFIIKEPHVSLPDNQKISSLHGNGESESENVFEQDPNNTNELDGSPGANIEDASFQPDIFDKRYWNSLDSKHVDILAHKGPKRDLQF
jgi:hypothetical protein